MDPILRKIVLARTTLLFEQPFFGVLALSLDVQPDPDCKTAWTDGRTLGYSPEFVETLTPAQLVGLIAHEVMHCALGHPWRREHRDPTQWNIAADYAINGLLDQAGVQLPAGALLDHATYDGKYAEWIYDRLPSLPPNGSQQQQQPGQQPDPSQWGEVRDAPAGADAPTQADWQQRAEQAKRMSRGTLPGDAQRRIDQALQPRADWRSLLRRFLSEQTRADYSWVRPNVRYVQHGLYLPSLHSHGCGRIAVAVDTSGSIDSILLSQFAAEINAIAGELQPAAIDVLYCDTRVHRIDHYDQGEPIEVRPAGGGGTSFRPVFDALRDDPPVALIYFTDLEGSFPTTAPQYPVLWAVYGGKIHAPFGEVIPCE